MSKKFLRTLVAALLICSMLTVPAAFAENATVTASDVNMRSGPGTNYPVVDCLPEGAEITVTDRSNPDWYAITYNGESGYMSARYLQISEQTPTQTEQGELNGHINAMYVRFRSDPVSGSAILGEYNTGKALTITGETDGWIACVIDGQAGYVYSQFVTRDDGTPAVLIEVPQQDPASGEDEDETLYVTMGQDQPETPAEEPDPTPAPTATPTPTPAPTATPTPTPAPTATPTPEPDPDEEVVFMQVGAEEPAEEPEDPDDPDQGKTGTIRGDFVRFRSGPGTGYRILGTYNTGKALTITGEGDGWTACVIDGKAGYVFTQYVKADETTDTEEPDPASTPTTTPEPSPAADPTPTPTPDAEEKGYISGNNVRFRSAPSMTAEILGELFYGNTVTITGTSGEWTAVTREGKSGYVFSQYVTKGEYGTGNSAKADDPVPDGTATGQQIVDYALQFVGYRYVWGGASPETGFDCSGLVYYVYGKFGYTMKRVANDQTTNGVHVDPDDLQPGDVLCFYSSGSYVGHVGIYIGNNKFVHAANSRSGVIISELSGYYSVRGFEARRILGT